MKLCAKCSPVTELRERPDGTLYCLYHEDAYVLREEPDAVVEHIEAVEDGQ